MTNDTTDKASQEIPAGWEGILEPGEPILWQGKPVGGIPFSEFFRASTAMSLFVAGFGIFWTIMAVTMMAESRTAPGAFRIFFPLFGVVFVCTALWGAFGSVVKKMRQRRGTYYTLSDRAAYVAIASMGERTIQRFPIDEMGQIILNAAEPGGVRFGDRDRQIDTGGRRTSHRMQIPAEFERIAEPRKVYGLLRTLIAERGEKA